MLINSETMKRFGYFFLFTVLLVLLQIENYTLLIVWATIALTTYFVVEESGKLYIISNILFGFGFIIYLFAKDYTDLVAETSEMEIFLDRISLTFI
ncbi:hypothetical protein JQK62_24530, partial [Leptospira santarosai]|nr:hypothetical protein [Leptospira santarosai]